MDTPYRNKWWILTAVSLALFMGTVDGTIVNVALPTLVRELGATTSDLQWIVDAYTLVFAGLLLAAGSLGDRFGRARALRLGLIAFGITSVLGALAQSPGQLVAARAAMGIGAALIFPATLAILTNVFTAPGERAKAIGIWTAITGLAVALGPVTGGWLLEHFWWGSVFLVNLPIVAVALVAGHFLVPESRDPVVKRLDPLGIALSISGVTLLVWAIIEAPDHGWTSTTSLVAFAGAAVLIGAFVAWELHSRNPMLDVRIFRNLRFSAASIAVTVAFFALFGFIFMVTQYMQFVRGCGTFEAGLRTVPFAVATGIAAPIAPVLVRRIGTKVVVAGGLALMSAGFLVASTTSATSAYAVIVASMALMGVGLGFTSAPATESIMGALPPERAGVGSAVNDTTRELGGTFGVAVAGSILASAYTTGLAEKLAGLPVPADALDTAQSSIGAAFAVADRATELVGPAAGDAIRGAASQAFIDGFHTGSVVLAVVALAGAVAALLILPARATEPAADGVTTDGAADGLALEGAGA